LDGGCGLSAGLRTNGQRLRGNCCNVAGEFHNHRRLGISLCLNALVARLLREARRALNVETLCEPKREGSFEKA
jgi:hypothetical protein